MLATYLNSVNVVNEMIKADLAVCTPGSGQASCVAPVKCVGSVQWPHSPSRKIASEIDTMASSDLNEFMPSPNGTIDSAGYMH